MRLLTVNNLAGTVGFIAGMTILGGVMLRVQNWIGGLTMGGGNS